MDREVINGLHLLAFDRPDEAGIVARVRVSEYFIPELSLVAELDGRVVGHALFSYVGLEGDEPARILALGPLAVHPAYQGRGIGSALIKEGLEVARARGEPLVVVLGHPGYYPRFGFAPSKSYGIEPYWEAMMVCPLQDDISRYRGKVVFPPAFL
jgi:putative acetyltransferase